MMTTTVKLYGWNFCFNKEITESYYKDYDDLCDCAMCRNFYNNAALINNDVRCFLEQFGIDVAKPIEQESIIADKSNNTVENTVYYVVNGSAKSFDKPDINIGMNCVTIVSPELSPNTNIQEPYFVFSVSDIWLPWTVDDDIDDCYN